MVSNLSQPNAAAALLDEAPNVVRPAICPMCHTGLSVTQAALDAGGGWRCVRCGQYWDARRLAAVASHAAWAADHDREHRRSTERGEDGLQYREPPTEGRDGTP
jgi:predicted Zn finger-like uncharacterized protein